MTEEKIAACTCGGADGNPVAGIAAGMPDRDDGAGGAACCGPPPGPAAASHERPGYRLLPFVSRFVSTPAGKVPVVHTRPVVPDRLGTVMARAGIGRNQYSVAPGLYGTGKPDEKSPVLVSANYKLSFDHLRCSLGSLSAWILVLDTRGVNVWCAAGKGTFATGELVHRIGTSRLEKVVTHRRVVVPQLGATGVDGREVKRLSGFRVVWGPVRALNIPAFLREGMKASAGMRRVTFGFVERLVLVPVEISLLWKYALAALAAALLLSGIGSGLFSFTAVLGRGPLVLAALLAGLLAGTVATPLLLPWLPPAAFAGKGFLAGAAAAIPVLVWSWGATDGTGLLALSLLAMAVSSHLSMNFTGSTPFTAPTGVEKEMRRYLPVQVVMGCVGIGLWLWSGFTS